MYHNPGCGGFPSVHIFHKYIMNFCHIPFSFLVVKGSDEKAILHLVGFDVAEVDVGNLSLPVHHVGFTAGFFHRVEL